MKLFNMYTKDDGTRVWEGCIPGLIVVGLGIVALLTVVLLILLMIFMSFNLVQSIMRIA